MDDSQRHTIVHQNQQRLTVDREEYLTKWILDEDSCAYLPSHDRMREMATLIFRSNGDKMLPLERIGDHTAVGRSIEDSRATAGNPETIRALFELFEQTVRWFDYPEPKNRTTTDRRTKKTFPYSINLEEILKSCEIFPKTSQSTAVEAQRVPYNIEIMRQKAKEHRPMLSSDTLTEDESLDFCATFKTSKTEKDVATLVVPILECQLNFVNETVKTSALVKETPDSCHGVSFERLNERIRKDLRGQMVPPNQPCDSISPNFSLELKGLEGHQNVADRQALYCGALGEGGQIALRSWGHNKLILDATAHTISCSLVSGLLTFFSIHTAQSRTPGRRIDNFMLLIDNFTMHFDYERFLKAVPAYQNLQENAEEIREESIRSANPINE
ncbi:hypothetical protein EPUL_001855 [Erysiphe pulchra]|uniref:Uncharacterized protein n=1 Tax=Erysiphe pulchra TaxID=225359 RepID=A0A2S4PWA4_9PEZI|nr:hypothetical protein EPUL_001855 [Erysiphe pulchra]